MGYGEYVEWLAGEGLDTSYADSGISPFKDYRETDPEEEDGWREEEETENDSE